MPFDWTEAVEDIPEVLALINKIEAGLALIPSVPVPPPAGGAPVKPYADLFASVLPEIGALVDLIKKQAAD
jgi:hypothetical protein